LIAAFSFALQSVAFSVSYTLSTSPLSCSGIVLYPYLFVPTLFLGVIGLVAKNVEDFLGSTRRDGVAALVLEPVDVINKPLLRSAGA
jgi:hypothetical protein